MEAYKKSEQSPEVVKEIEQLGQKYDSILKGHLGEILEKMREVDGSGDEVHCHLNLKRLFPDVATFWKSIPNNKRLQDHLDDIGESCIRNIMWQKTEMREILHTEGRIWWTSYHYHLVDDEKSKESDDQDKLLKELEGKIKEYETSDRSNERYNTIVGLFNTISGLDLSDENRKKLRELGDNF